MTRDIDPNALAVLESSNVPWVVLLRLDFDSGTLFLHSGVGDLSWDGNDWLGIGALGQLSGVVEKAEGADNRTRVTLCPIPKQELSNLVDEVTNDDPVGRPYKLYYAVVDSDREVIDDAIVMSSGTMDKVELTDGEVASLSIDLVSDAARLKKRVSFKLTNQHQQGLFSSDLGLAFVNDLGREIRWGSAPKTTVGGSGGTHGGSGGGGAGAGAGGRNDTDDLNRIRL